MNNQNLAFPGNFRVHIGLAVSDVARSIDFYTSLFGEPPVKIREGYAKFEPRDPSVNLSLNQVSGVLPRNAEAHFGIQVKSPDQLASVTNRLRVVGLPLEFEKQVACCYAVQDKIWATDPDGNAWEVFLVTLDDAQSVKAFAQPDGGDCCQTGCCESTGESEQKNAGLQLSSKSSIFCETGNKLGT